MPQSLVVSGSRLVTPDGVRAGQLLIIDGRIHAIADRDDALPIDARPAGATLIDAGDAYVLPGLIDSHVHFRTPGLTHKEDWAHRQPGRGSRAV